MTIPIGAPTICPDCFECRAVVELTGPGADSRRQLCRCERERLIELAPRWPGYDFNKAIDLCSCCGFEPIETGSRWSVFCCAECKDRVLAFNRACGDWVIPIGRHSLQNGLALKVVLEPAGSGSSNPATSDREQIEGYIAAVQGLSGRVRRLKNHKTSYVQGNLTTLGLLPASAQVDLRRYVNAARAFPLRKEDAFMNLRAHMARSA